MPAEGAPSQLSGTCGSELLADLRARGLPGTTILDQGRAGLEHERLHLLGLTLEHLGDLGVIEGADLRKDESSLLTLGQVVEVCEQLAELATPLDFLGETRRGISCHVLDRCFTARAQHREAPIARDDVEPRLDLRRLSIALQGAKSRGKGLLKRVLGVLPGAEHVTAEGEEPAVVTVVHDREGGVVTALDLGGETLVAEGSE